ncbi:hypothetical protein D3C81_1379950 [compost metagenome]
MHDHTDVLQVIALEGGRDGAWLRLALVHADLEVVIRGGVRAQPGPTHAAQRGQQRQAEHFMPHGNDQAVTVEGQRAARAVLVGG